MGFSEAIASVFKNYANFKGRARRKEYWYFVIFNMIASGLLTGISTASESTFFMILQSLYTLAVAIPSLAVIWRRLHDIGKSGACYFVALIPLVGAIIVLIWLCKDSQPGDNQYGPNPKAPAAQPGWNYGSNYTNY